MTIQDDLAEDYALPGSEAADRALARIVAQEIVAASRALEFAERTERENQKRAVAVSGHPDAIRRQYCRAWLDSLTTIARTLP